MKDNLVVIDAENCPAAYQSQYRLSRIENDDIQQHVREMVEQNVIEPSKSPYRVPLFLVRKKDGTRRVIVDFRKLSISVIHKTYLIPCIDDMFDRLVGSCIYASLDAMQGFWQLALDENLKKNIDFLAPDGKLQYNRMPLYINVPAEFQSMMDCVIGQLQWTTALVYILRLQNYWSVWLGSRVLRKAWTNLYI